MICEFSHKFIPYQHTKPSPGNPYYERVKEIILSRTMAEWAEFSVKVDCCMAPVLHTSELADSTLVKERKFIEEKWGMQYVSTFYTGEDSFLNFDKPYSKLGEENQTLINQL